MHPYAGKLAAEPQSVKLCSLSYMAPDWIEVRIESFADSGELLSQLDDPAVTGAWQENGVIHLFWPAPALGSAPGASGCNL